MSLTYLKPGIQPYWVEDRNCPTSDPRFEIISQQFQTLPVTAPGTDQASNL